MPEAIALAAQRPPRRAAGPVEPADRRLTGSLGAVALEPDGPRRWRVGTQLARRLLEIELENRTGYAEHLHARLQEPDGAELERLRTLEAKLVAIESGRWWRLRGTLRRVVPGWR
jgi:hypothetical protein